MKKFRLSKTAWSLLICIGLIVSFSSASFASMYRFKDILTEEALKARMEKGGYSSIETLDNNIAATAFLSNDRLKLYFTEQNSDVWEFLYDVGNNSWGESCYHEHYAIWTQDTGIMESENFIVETAFTDSGGEAGSITAVLTTGEFQITRTVMLESGDKCYFQMKYKIKNTGQSTVNDVRFFETIDFDIPTTASCDDDYGWYESDTDYIGIMDEPYFRNGIRSNIRSSAHGMEHWSTEIYDDWDDGQLNGANSYGPGDPGIGKQFNIGNMAPGQEWEVILTIWFGNRTEEEAGYRVWIDKNNNDAYDAGEGVENAHVWINNEGSERGTTNSDGLIALQNINDSDNIYAYKHLYSIDNPKAVDGNFGSREKNPYYASNGTDSVNGIMYNFVMASDIMADNGKYYDFPGQNKDLQDAGKDTEGNLLIELVHPKIEWNLVVTFEDEQSDDKVVPDIKEGFRKAADYIYNYTDGYSIIRNVVLCKGAYKGDPQWDWSTVQINNKFDRWNANWGRGLTNPQYKSGIRDPQKSHTHIDKRKPTGSKWQSSLGHELGHHLFGFGDEYQNGDYTKSTSSRDTQWTYRINHSGAWHFWPPPSYQDPNEFPKNYGVMDHHRNTHEISDCTDYLHYSSNPTNPDHTTHNYMQRSWQSTWEWFEEVFEDEIGAKIQNFNSTNLIIPPNTTGSYNDSNNYDKRNNPTSMNHNSVNFIEWSPPTTANYLFAASTDKVFDAILRVLDESGSPIPNADVWLTSGPRKTFQGVTDKDGILECGGLRIGKKLEIYFCGLKADRAVNERKQQFNVTMPLSLTPKIPMSVKRHSYIAQDSIPGVVVSAKPDDSSSTIVVTLSGDSFDDIPAVILQQPTGFTSDVPMMPSGPNIYTGNTTYDYYSGYFEIVASSGSYSNQSANSFIVHDVEAGLVNTIYSPNGGLEITFFSDSLNGSGKIGIIKGSAVPPANNNLVQVGYVWSIEYSDGVGSLNHLKLSIKIPADAVGGLNINEIKLYGWNKENSMWNVISGGGNDLDSFSISLDNIDYTSYALFAPASSDVLAPNPITNLQVTTGDSRQRIDLQWTAPSDNQSASGTSTIAAETSVYAYDIRYNTIPITESNWDDSTPIGLVPPPAVPGTTQSTSVEMPDPNTDYYFAMRSIDSAGNKSTITSLSSPTTSQATDTDGDGMPDLWETSNSLNPNVDDSQNDDEGDGLKNIEEYQNDTDPKDADTDNDGYLDGDEVNRGSDPNDPESTPGSSIALSSMWNLISLYRQPADSSVSTVLDGIAGQYASVWAYINGSWKVYDPQNPGFSDLSTIESGYGYWIFMITNGYLGISGSPPAISINLNTDWNLVGYNSSSAQPIADALASIAGKYISVWAFVNGAWKVYDPANPGFSDLTTMEPGYGYWINTTEACTWTLP